MREIKIMKIKTLLKELSNYKLIILSSYSNVRSKNYLSEELISDYMLNKKVIAYTFNFENNILLIYYD